MQEITCLAIFTAKQNREQDLKSALQNLVPLTRAETGCLQYELKIHTDKANQFLVFEKFKDQAAFEFHLSREYLQDFVNRVMPEIVENAIFDQYISAEK